MIASYSFRLFKYFMLTGSCSDDIAAFVFNKIVLDTYFLSFF
mgnify:CR=1 FL=1